MTFTDLLRNQLVSAGSALAAVSREVVSYREVSDEELLELAAECASVQRAAGSTAAILAGEIARRSSPQLGYAGLSQRTGHRTPVELVRVTTGLSARDAAASVRVGLFTQDAADDGTPDPLTGEIAGSSRPWLVALGVAVTAGSLSVAAADSIAHGLGEPSESVPSSILAEAIAALILLGAELDVDRLFRRARELRVELDSDAVAQREDSQRAARSLKLFRLPDGMARLVWVMDPETAAAAGELFDRATSPRRGGPRFVGGDGGGGGGGGGDGVDLELARRIANDERTTEQLASDVFVELLRQGSAADSSQLLGSGAPVIRVLVAQTAFDARVGHGRMEGHSDPVSIATIERYGCSADLTPILFDFEGQPLDVGRDSRLFNRRQRVALAARDGGCMFPGCERPPSWCEAHHIKHWSRDHGESNVADGILLCRHHHLLVHNNGWEIERSGARYALVPPAEVDQERTRIPLPSKSAVYRQLIAREAS